MKISEWIYVHFLRLLYFFKRLWLGKHAASQEPTYKAIYVTDNNLLVCLCFGCSQLLFIPEGWEVPNYCPKCDHVLNKEAVAFWKQKEKERNELRRKSHSIGCDCGHSKVIGREEDHEYGQYYIFMECKECGYYWEGYYGYLE